MEKYFKLTKLFSYIGFSLTFFAWLIFVFSGGNWNIVGEYTFSIRVGEIGYIDFFYVIIFLIVIAVIFSIRIIKKCTHGNKWSFLLFGAGILFIISRVACSSGGFIIPSYCGYPSGHILIDAVFWLIIASFLLGVSRLFTVLKEKVNTRIQFIISLLFAVITIIITLYIFIFIAYDSFDSQAGYRDIDRVEDLFTLQSWLSIYYSKLGYYSQNLNFSFVAKEIEDKTGDEAPYNRTDPLDPKFIYMYRVSKDEKNFILGARLERKKNDSWLSDKLNKDIDGFIFGVDCNDPVYCVGPLEVEKTTL